MNKIKENQHFTTIDSVSVFGLILVVSFIFVSIMGNSLLDKKAEIAESDASRLASSLVSTNIAYYGLPEQSSAQRSIASEGTKPSLRLENSGRIGLDPWGRAYHYQIRKASRGRRVAIVLSMGPNMRLETGPDQFISDKDGAFVELTNQGDDIAAIISR